MKSFKLLFFLSLMSVCFSTAAQNASKINLQLQEHLQNVGQTTKIPLLVEGDPEQIPQIINSLGGKLRLQLGQLFSIDLPSATVKEFAANNAVYQIEFDQAPAHYFSDTMLIQTRANQVQQMLAPLRQKYSGKGVVLGVIDSGIELDHPDFQDSLGRTRVLYIWDQKAAYDPNRQAAQYSYGVEWDSTDINQNISTHDDDPAGFGHGSNVTGAAASNALATGNFMGVAPEVNIISVATDFSKANWLQTVAEAVDYIYQKADSLNMPCVINASIGTYFGSHDGKDIAARMIDQMIKAKSGRTLVAAAGNAGQFKFHLQHQAQQDTLFSWMSYENHLFNGQGGLYFQLWADTADLRNLKFAIGADRKVGNYYEFRGRTAFDSVANRLNVIYYDSIVNNNNQKIADIVTYAEQSQGRYLLEFAIPQPDSNQYLFRLESCGQGKFDLWSSRNLTGTSDILEQNLPTLSQYPPMLNYVYPDSLQTIASSFTCLPSVITVGNYINRSSWIDVNGNQQYVNVVPGQISPNSSLGPNREGYLKPDLSSAGDYMFSAGRLATIATTIQSAPAKISADSMHMRNGGTSMAAPTVAGMIALYLEQCSAADHQMIKNDLLQSSRTDQFSTAAPSPKWGVGKADAFGFLQRNVFSPQVTMPLPDYCDGDTAFLALSSFYQSYRWSNGDNGSIAAVTDSGSYFVEVMDSVCKSVSDTVLILFKDSPPKPQLIQRNDSLISPVAGSYRWYFNSSLLPGKTDSILRATQSGLYHAEVISSNGCNAYSDTINYLSTTIQENEINGFQLYPNPTDNFVTIESEDQIESIKLYELSGKMVLFENILSNGQPFRLDVGHLKAGIYFIEVNSEKKLIRKKMVIW